MKRVFAWMYKLASTQEDKTFCLIKTLVYFSIFAWINILSIIIFINRILFGSRFRDEEGSVFFIFSMLIMILYEYFAFLHKKKYKSVVKRYESTYLISAVGFFLYIFLTAIAFILVCLFRRNGS